MSKRQRFFVELREDEVTVISWKQLVANAERIPDVTQAAAASPPPSSSNSTAQNPLKPRKKLKLDAPRSKVEADAAPTVEAAERKRRGSPLGDRNTNSAGELNQKDSKHKMIKAVRDEWEEMAKPAAVPSVVKGKVRRSMPVPCSKSSCRTKKAKACFCCPKKGNITA